MGWTNYLVLKKYKVAFEISKHLEDVDDWEKKALDLFTEENDDYFIFEKNIEDLTFDNYLQIGTLAKAFQNLRCDDVSKLLIFWAFMTKQDYEILEPSKFEDKEGYVIVGMKYE